MDWMRFGRKNSHGRKNGKFKLINFPRIIAARRIAPSYEK
jgi:hypothetical protein